MICPIVKSLSDVCCKCGLFMLCASLNVATGGLWGLLKLIVLQLEVVLIKVKGCMTVIEQL